VSEVAHPAVLDARVDGLAAEIAAKSPKAVRLTNV
jgi:enoyl-CoA hydratase/carnithine racemase